MSVIQQQEYLDAVWKTKMAATGVAQGRSKVWQPRRGDSGDQINAPAHFSWKAGQVLSRALRWRRAQARYSPCTARRRTPSTVAATG